MSALLTANWFPVGDNMHFRKIDLYNTIWASGIDFDNMLICPAPYGGPFAVVQDRKKLVKIQVVNKPVISIFSSSGQRICSILWNSGILQHMGWSSEENLLCVKNDGQVLIYDMLGSLKTMFSMGEEASAVKIVAAKIFPSTSGTGLAVLTTSLRVYLVNSVVEPKVRHFPAFPSSVAKKTFSSWEIVSDKYSTSVIISTGSELTLLRQGETPTPMRPAFREEYSGFMDMAVSLDNRKIALLTDTGVLWLGSSDMRTKFCEVNTNCTSRPRQIVWCGAQAVVGNWAQDLLIVSLNGGVAKIPSDNSKWLVPEIDAIRVISPFNHELIQEVPNVTQKLFRINSSEPGSYLLEASKQFERKSHTSYDYISLVRDQMELAIAQCLEGALYEFDPQVQKSLLKAAKLGRSFLPDAQANEFVTSCRMLRVLNAVRANRIGIPLTSTQLRHLRPRNLLDRLVYRKFYKLAIEMANYLKMSDAEGASRILSHWACYKVKQEGIDENELAMEIGQKLRISCGVSFSEIANEAINAGRTQLAIKLLDFEPHPDLQVPLLLRLNQRKVALEKSINSGNTDLILRVMLSLRETMPLGDFQLLIRSYPLAQNLFMKYCRLHSPKTLRDIIFQEDNHAAQAACFLEEYFDPKNTTKETSLISAIECFTKAKDTALATLCKDEQKLLNHQRALEEKFGRDFVGKSLHDTIYTLLMLKELKLAERMKSDYKVTDRRFWWLRIQTLAELDDWAELDKFSKSKKSPIGYEPFVDACLRRKKLNEASKYLSKVREDLKLKYFIKAGLYDEAADLALAQSDIEGLRFVLSSGGARNPELAEKIKQYINQLGSKK